MQDIVTYQVDQEVVNPRLRFREHFALHWNVDFD